MAEAIGPLIDRLDKETGRLEGDLVDALEDLTGKHYGFSPANWQGWWRVHGEGFVVPAPSDEPGEGGEGTVVGYYGIRIRSERIIFLVDRSGSMSANFQASGVATTPKPGDR